MKQIRYLKQKEKQNTREMYEAVFSEDSKRFIDYYYQWKTRDNQILVLEDNAGYEVMMHLNPYSVRVNGTLKKIPYIVAVATRPDCRRQGKMQQVMKRALQDLQKIHCPFTFLLPADPAYYYGQGFVFAPKSCKNSGNEQSIIKHIETTKFRKAMNVNCVVLDGVNQQKMQQAVETANAILAEQYDVYIQRDRNYYERLLEEVASEHGKVFLIEDKGITDKGQVIGILAYGREERAEIKEFLLFSQYEEVRKEICDRIFGAAGWQEEEMRMMFRITDLQSLSGMVKGEPELLIVEVTDSMVEANNGIWQMEWNPQGGSVTRLKETVAKKQMDISEVTEKVVKKMSIFIREWV